MSARRAGLIAARELRAAAWPPLAVAAALGAAIVALDGSATTHLRLAAVGLCGGFAFALHDCAREPLAACPTAPARRLLARLAPAAALVAAVWTALLWRAGGAPGAALTLELAAMLALTLAATAVAARAGVADAAAAGATALPVALAAAWVALPAGMTLFVPAPDDPRWGASHVRWALVLAAAAAIAAWAGRDPARRPAPTGLANRRRGAAARHQRQGGTS